MLPPLPRCSGWAYSSLISPSHVSLPRKGHRVGLHIVLFEACSAFTRVAACTLARSPYFVTCYPKASDISSPPCLLRLLPAGANRRVGLAPTGKRRLVTAHPQSRQSGAPNCVCIVQQLCNLDRLVGQESRFRSRVPDRASRPLQASQPARRLSEPLRRHGGVSSAHHLSRDFACEGRLFGGGYVDERVMAVRNVEGMTAV